jgi:hypothetical protein
MKFSLNVGFLLYGVLVVLVILPVRDYFKYIPSSIMSKCILILSNVYFVYSILYIQDITVELVVFIFFAKLL